MAAVVPVAVESLDKSYCHRWRVEERVFAFAHSAGGAQSEKSRKKIFSHPLCCMRWVGWAQNRYGGGVESKGQGLHVGHCSSRCTERRGNGVHTGEEHRSGRAGTGIRKVESWGTNKGLQKCRHGGGKSGAAGTPARGRRRDRKVLSWDQPEQRGVC